MYERRQAFRNAIQDSPQALQLNVEFEAASQKLRDLPAVGQNRVISAWETLSDPPTTEWLVEGAFTTPSLTLLVGDPGAKKSFLALDLAVCIAAGKDWLGHSVRSPGQASSPLTEPAPSPLPAQAEGVGGRRVGTGLKPVLPLPSTGERQPHEGRQGEGSPVLYIDEESGFHTMWSRLNSAVRGHQAPPRIPLYYISLAGYNLRNPSDADVIINRAVLLGARFIIIDALANVTHGADENNVLSVQPVFANLRRVAQASNAAVLVIHHTNKQGIFRGSTSISAGVDHLLIVESKPNDPLLNLRTLKSRSIAPLALTARANFEEGKFWLTSTDEQLIPALGSAATALLRHLTNHGPATAPQLFNAFPSSTSGAIRKLINDLLASGHLVRANEGSKGTPALYSLPTRVRHEN